MIIKDKILGKDVYLNENQYIAAKTIESTPTIAFYLIIALVFLAFTSIWIVLFFVILFLTHVICNNKQSEQNFENEEINIPRIAFRYANKFTVGLFLIPLLPVGLGYLNFHYLIASDDWIGPSHFYFDDIYWILKYHRYMFICWLLITISSAWLSGLIVEDAVASYLTEVSTPKRSIISSGKWLSIVFTICVEVITFFDGQFLALHPLKIAFCKILTFIPYTVLQELDYILR